MSRSIQLAVPAEMADALQSRLQGMQGVVGLCRYRGASLQPLGDVLVVNTTNDTARSVFAILTELRVSDVGSILTNSPNGLICSGNADGIQRETNEAVWEEMESHLRLDTNLSFNYLAMMLLAGGVGAAGLWADMLHIVVGAMVIAPAFEPLVRIPFGLLVGPRSLALRGLWSTAAGYLMVLLGGMLAALFLRLLDASPSSILESRVSVRYWSSFTTTGVLASVFGSLAGAIIISGLRSTMTTGVMIALALVPSMAIVGMGVGTGDLPVAASALARWGVDALLVLAASALVFAAKKRWLHHRGSLG